MTTKYIVWNLWTKFTNSWSLASDKHSFEALVVVQNVLSMNFYYCLVKFIELFNNVFTSIGSLMLQNRIFQQESFLCYCSCQRMQKMFFDFKLFDFLIILNISLVEILLRCTESIENLYFNFKKKAMLICMHVFVYIHTKGLLG